MMQERVGEGSNFGTVDKSLKAPNLKIKNAKFEKIDETN